MKRFTEALTGPGKSGRCHRRGACDFVLKTMNSAINPHDVLLKTMNFSLKMVVFASKMIYRVHVNAIAGSHGCRRPARDGDLFYK